MATFRAGEYESDIQRAAEAIAATEALLIAAGAGMGVDSGLPDFRGSEGFWQAYPPYRKLGLGTVACITAQASCTPCQI
jgi:NAD-dependent SIR2 family protein deacetylase